MLLCKILHAICGEIIVVRAQWSAALFILAPCLTGLISTKLNNSQVNDPSFCWVVSSGPWRISAGSPVPILKAPAVIVLTKALRHKPRMYNVVSSLVGLHHMEAAMASTVERALELKLSHLILTATEISFACTHLKCSKCAPIIQAAFGTRPQVLCSQWVLLSCQTGNLLATSLGSCLKLSQNLLSVKNNAQIIFFSLTGPQNYHLVMFNNLSCIFSVWMPQEEGPISYRCSCAESGWAFFW